MGRLFTEFVDVLAIVLLVITAIQSQFFSISVLCLLAFAFLTVFHTIVKCLLKASTSYVPKCYFCGSVKFIIRRKVVTLQPWEQIEIEWCQIKHGVAGRHWFSLLEVCIVVEELCLIVQCKYIFMDSAVEFLNARSQVQASPIGWSSFIISSAWAVWFGVIDLLSCLYCTSPAMDCHPYFSCLCHLKIVIFFKHTYPSVLVISLRVAAAFKCFLTQ
jgi:hypothetical protein